MKFIERYIFLIQVINFYKFKFIAPRQYSEIKKILVEFDEIIFTGVMQTEFEHILYIAAKKQKKSLGYHPYNWDNPTSKIAYPQMYFDIVYPWGEQMYQHLKKILPNVSEEFKPPPRFRFLEIQSNSNAANPKYVSVFGSTKDNPELIRKK